MSEKIHCTIDNIRFQNEDNGYTVASVTASGHGETVIVGSLPSVYRGAVVECVGSWETSKYGRQFRVDSYKEETPASVEGIKNYLSSGLIKGIGKVTAERIVGKFGEKTIHILDNNPKKLLSVSGISEKKLKGIVESWRKHRDVKDVMVFLQTYGVTPVFAAKVYKKYGNESISKIKENPYRLADDLIGCGFKTADELAGRMGVSPESTGRLCAGIGYTLTQMATEGHSYATRNELMAKCMEILCVDGNLVAEAMESAADRKDIIREEDRYYLPMYYYAEKRTAEKLGRIIAAPRAKDGYPDIARIEKENGIKYDEHQVDAVMTAAKSKVMVLTGGPGTGKSTVTNGIIKGLADMGMEILLAAPTGRAAKRLSETTGREAKTIHRLLEYNPNDSFKRNENNPLKGDVLIVDECSMIDIMLMYALVKAVPESMHLVMVGDIDQLPSVGAGNVLRDIIDSGSVSVVRLTKIFRQAATSRIVLNAHAINEGRMPDCTNEQGTDFFFIAEDDTQKMAESIIGLVRDRLPKYYGYEPKDIQVLTPMRKGDVGTINLNMLLQSRLNSNTLGVRYSGTTFLVGDRVMQIKNNYDKKVFNGDMGFVVGVDTEDNTVTVLYEGVPEPVEYEKGDLNELTLSYAVTIHKSQGSEFPVVVMPITYSHFIMLQRNLIYTGVTRAKKVCVLVGEKRALAYAVRNMVVTKRNTRLKDRLRNKNN